MQTSQVSNLRVCRVFRGDDRQQGVVTPRADSGGLGPRLRRSSRFPAGMREPVTQEDRGEAVHSHLPADRTLGGVSIPPASRTGEQPPSRETSLVAEQISIVTWPMLSAEQHLHRRASRNNAARKAAAMSSDTCDDEKLLTKGEVAQLCGVDVRTVDGWRVAGKVRCHRPPSGRMLFRRYDVLTAAAVAGARRRER